MNDIFVLEARPKIVFGVGAIDKLKENIDKYNNVLFVYGMGSINKSGLYDKVISNIKDKNIYELGGVAPNPRLSKIYEGINLCKENNIDLILAIGGGSVMDTAKAIALGSKSEEDIWEIIVNKKEVEDSIDICLVPTMIATGSETNDIFVVYNDEINLKRSLKHKLTYPKLTIMDPALTLTINRRQTVAGIVDTLSHLLEQYVNNKEYIIINDLIATYFKRMLKVGEKLVNDLENIDLREEHMYIAMSGYNGDYRTIVGGDFACHGLDYGLGSEFDTYHGEGLSILTCNWLNYVYKNKEQPKVISKFIEDVFNEIDTLKGIEMLRDYLKLIGAPLKFSDILDKNINLTEEVLNRLVEKSQFVKPLGTTINLDEEDIRNIYKMCDK